MSVNKKVFLKKLFIYLLGTALIAISANISKMSSIGMTPVSSLPLVCENIWGVTLGTTTFIVYIFFIVLQILILRKRFPLRNLLGLILTFWLSFMIDLTGIDPKALGHLMLNFPQPGSYPMRLLYLAVSLVIGAAGAFLYIHVNWVPLPTDGCAWAISQVSGRPFGDCKTFTDTVIVIVALVLQLAFLGGLSSFTRGRVAVREGTILAAIIIGQIVKLFAKKIGPVLDKWIEK